MAGKDYSDRAYHISKRFDDLATSIKDSWQDEQANRFGYDYINPIDKALTEMQLSIEKIIDVLDSKLNEIREIANGR